MLVMAMVHMALAVMVMVTNLAKVVMEMVVAHLEEEEMQTGLEEIVMEVTGTKESDLSKDHRVMMQTKQTLWFNDPRNTIDNYWINTPSTWEPSLLVNKKVPKEKPGSRYVAQYEPSLTLEKKSAPRSSTNHL